MKISLVVEDAGSGPQVIFSSNEPDEARRFFKAHNAPGKLMLVCNPSPDNVRTIKAAAMPEKPINKRSKETLI